MYKKSLLSISLGLVVVSQYSFANESWDVQSAFSTATHFGESAVNVGEVISELTSGTLTTNVYNPGELVPPFEILSSISSGAIPAGWSTMAYFTQQIPSASAFGNLPFSPPADIFFSWVFDGEGLDIIQEDLDAYGVKIVPCAYVPQEAGGWFNKKLETPDDIKGLSIRIAGIGANVYEKLGASPQLLPHSEAYLALERGRVDAIEVSIPEIDAALGMDDAASYYYFPGWQGGPTFLAYYVNQSAWDLLSTDQKKAIEVACKANIQDEFNSLIARQDSIIEKFEEKDGVEVLRFPDEVLDQFHMAWLEVVEEEKISNPDFKEAYDSLIDHAKKFDGWNELQAMPGDI